MLYKKLYWSARLFFYSKREVLNKIAVILMITILSYFVINNIFFTKIILGKANYEEIKQNYPKAITFYSIAYKYYGLNHFSENNKHIYFEIPYKISLCYLQEKNKQDSIKSLFEGLKNIQKEYGVYSKENAYFSRMYLIDFYLINNRYNLACKEFTNMIKIYRKVGYGNLEVADTIRIKGDLAYQQKNYDLAIDFYKKAINNFLFINKIDYTIYSRTIDRICNYYIENNNPQEAIKTYASAIDFVKKSNKNEKELRAQMLIKLANLYSLNDKTVKSAILCYEDALLIIDKLPSTTYSKQNINVYLQSLKNLYDLNNEYTKSREIEMELARKRRFSFL